MTNDEREVAALRIVELSRRAFRRTAEKLEANGARLEDVVIGLAFAAQDVSARYKGEHHAAIEWLRTALDLQEKQLMEGANGKQATH